MTEPNNILHFLKKATNFLEKKGLVNPRIDAEWLLSDLLNLPRIKLYAQFEMPLSLGEVESYRQMIVERGKKKPVAYITGKKGFHKFDFKVNEHVLIPRPETEELVEWFYKNHKSHANLNQESILLDLGTGSGCIAISIARLLPELKIWASDISVEAIAIAKENQKLIPTTSKNEVIFLVSDLFSSFPTAQMFDVILTNPPYIPESEKDIIMDDVLLFEPHSALFIEDFESFHQNLLSSAYSRLASGGILLMETHPKFIKWLEQEALKIGFLEIKLIKDSSQKNRFLFAKKG